MKKQLLAEEDQPQYKLRNNGAAALTNNELMYLLIGDAGKSILQQAKNSLRELGKMSLPELKRIKGLGDGRSALIIAAIELGRRRQMEECNVLTTVTTSRDIANWLQTRLADADREQFIVIYLNQSNRIKHHEVISTGGITGTIADPRIILRSALEQKAVGMILCHNHPSGSLKPSRQDEEITRKIKEAAKYFDIKVLDHIIVSETGYFSFADEGIL